MWARCERAALLGSVWLCCCAMTAGAQPAIDTRPPEWLWAAGDSAPRQRVALRTAVEIPALVRSAHLRCAAEYCQVRVTIGGQTIGVVEDFAPWVNLDVTRRLRPGRQEVLLEAVAGRGPAAVACELTWTTADGQSAALRSGPQWQSRIAVNGTQDQQSWQPAVSAGAVRDELWGIGGVPAATTPFDDYEQWRKALDGASATDPKTFFAPPGFEVELLRAAAADEGSWVAVACDPQGRIVIAREDRGLLRLRLAADRRRVEQVELINDTLEECRGLLFAHDALYANANNLKGLYRLRDTDRDDTFDEVRLLREFPGGPGHGRNQLALGPDGMIYSIHGDAVELPAENIIDHTSPLREARRRRTSKEGHLVRTDASGTRWELMVAGLRNPFGVAFHPEHGEPFTYDADAEFDMGSAWYRPTRVLHLVSGGDFGWRGVTGKWPPYFPDHADNALPVADIGHGSPTAVKFGDRSTFPPRYRGALFILDWAYGRVIAVHVAPRGASYVAAAETFLRGRPLNVTGLDFGNDGAMYLVTGGRKTQSALYRIRYVGPPVAAPSASPHESAAERFAATQRELRRRLEALHTATEPSSPDFAWPHLGDRDPAIRYAARTAIEHLPVERWQNRALGEADPETAITALLALARAGRADFCPQVLSRLNSLSLDNAPQSVQLSALQAYDLCLAEPQSLSESLTSATARRLLQLVPKISHADTISPIGMGGPLVRQLCPLLIRLDVPEGVPLALAELAAAERQEERMHYLFILRNARVGWTPERRIAYFTALAAAATVRGGQGMPGFLTSIRANAVTALSDDERNALGRLIAPPSEPFDEPAPTRSFVRQWRIEDLADVLAADLRAANLARGRKLYREALCARCHRFHEQGQSFGPDLTSLSGRFTRRDMLESILAPSLVVADNFRSMEVVTKDGRIMTGRVVESGDYRQSILRVATDPLRPWQTVDINKHLVEQYRESPVSPMPEGLLNTLSRDEILDLIAYLERGPE